MSREYLWPLSNSTKTDEMNTSFGPRIKYDCWDFHDGIDLPAPVGKKVYAMRQGRVRHAGPSGTGDYSSRHVVIEVDDMTSSPLYNVYLHLDSIASDVVTGASVKQGQVIGTVGDDGALYPHLHFEFRLGTHKEIGSVHPLNYLPYANAAVYEPTTTSRFNWLDGFLAARIDFNTVTSGTNGKFGDLRQVKVELRRGAKTLTTHDVDFDDKASVNDARGDSYRFVDDIAVEGYQKSNMVGHGRTNLAYGVIVRKIPQVCDTLRAELFDVQGKQLATSTVAVPREPHDSNWYPVDEFVDFEDGFPSTWRKFPSDAGARVRVTAGAAHSGTNKMHCLGRSTADTRHRGGIGYTLPKDRFEWRFQGWLNPTHLDLDVGDWVHLLRFAGDDHAVAARIRNFHGTLRAGLVVASLEDAATLKTTDDEPIIATGQWRKWRLELLRVATRETTAILYLDVDGRMTEQARLNWDFTGDELRRAQAGIGLLSKGASASVYFDELWLTESGL